METRGWQHGHARAEAAPRKQANWWYATDTAAFAKGRMMVAQDRQDWEHEFRSLLAGAGCNEADVAGGDAAPIPN